jgi:hypothetical protein
MCVATTPSGTEIILHNIGAGNTNISFTFINSRFVICDYMMVWNILPLTAVSVLRIFPHFKVLNDTIFES